jgi:hypothetical protein
MFVQENRRLALSAFLLAAASFSACGTLDKTSYCKTVCGSIVASENPVYSCDEYRKIEVLWLQEIQAKIPDACQTISGYVSWELPGFSSLIYVDRETKKELWAVGWTVCEDARIYFHTGDGYLFKDDMTRPRKAWETAWTHELTHAAQKCNAVEPVDEGLDPAHANWNRDDLMNIPSRINAKLNKGE